MEPPKGSPPADADPTLDAEYVVGPRPPGSPAPPAPPAPAPAPTREPKPEPNQISKLEGPAPKRGKLDGPLPAPAAKPASKPLLGAPGPVGIPPLADLKSSGASTHAAPALAPAPAPSAPAPPLAPAPAPAPAPNPLQPRFPAPTHFAAAGIVIVALALPTYLAVQSQTIRDAGVGAFIALFFALLGTIVANVRLLISRKYPRALGLAAFATGLTASAVLIAGLSANALRFDAQLAITDDAPLEPGMREYLAGEAQASARIAALLGLLAIPGYLIGALNLMLVLGARRIAETAARVKNVKSGTVEKVTPVWLALIGSTAVFLYGLVVVVPAIFRSVERTDNPRAADVARVAVLAEEGKLTLACDELERVLAPGFVPESLLEEKLPGRLDLAHRCVERAVEDLPSGKSCEKAADKLIETETVKLADAKQRVRAACVKP